MPRWQCVVVCAVVLWASASVAGILVIVLRRDDAATAAADDNAGFARAHAAAAEMPPATPAPSIHAAAAALPSPPRRPETARPPAPPQQPHRRQCATTHGKHLITDQYGRVCAWTELKPDTNCCPTFLPRNQCGDCRRAPCCSSYEHCVSCCMGRTDMQFHRCKSACRTSRHSLDRHQKYADDTPYCWAQRAKSGGPAAAANAPAGATDAAGGKTLDLSVKSGRRRPRS